MTANSGRREAGLTLIELMVAVLVSSLLIGLVFAIYVRMSVSYREEQLKAELQQTLRAAREVVLRDVRAAGFQISSFRTATGAFGSTPIDDLAPLHIINDYADAGPDLLRLYFADPTAIVAVSAISDPDRAALTVTLNENTRFHVGDVVTLSVPESIDPGDGSPIRMRYNACVLKVTGIVGGDTIEVADVPEGQPYNNTNNTHCDLPAGLVAGGRTGQLALFSGRSYRIDPDRPELGVLQVSPSGELAGADWIDLGVGFTDLQLASRYFEAGDTDDLDLFPDGDPEYDWYSGESQEAPSPFSERPANSQLVQLSVSFAARSPNEVSGVGSRQTPAFIDDSSAEAIAHNRFGDSPSIDLTAPQASLPVRHRGNRVYRWSSTLVDLRNMGVGR